VFIWLRCDGKVRRVERGIVRDRGSWMRSDRES
jgi:hypothetical protein